MGVTNYKRKVGVSIVGGAGGVSSNHLFAYRLLGARIVAICDTNTVKGPNVAKEHKAFFTDNYEEMLNQPGIDIVDICSPDNYHCKQSVLAAKYGYHILCQKPIAMSIEECKQIKKAVEKAGVKFMAMMTCRWNSYHIKMKELISEGVIGKPVFISYQIKGTFYPYPKNSFYRKKESLGQFLHNGVHFVDEVCDFFDDVPKKVYGVTTSYFISDNILETPNYHLANIEMSKGGIAKIEYNELLVEPPAPKLSLNIFIVGTKGSIEYSQQEKEGLLHLRGKEIINVEFPDEIYSLSPFVKGIGHFLDCVRENRNPVISLDTSIKVIQACLGVIDSASTGKPVIIE